MKILESKGICIILMIVLIAGGFLLGGYAGLSGQYQKAADVFFLGENRDGICAANDMAERAAALTNMQTIAKKYPAVADSVLEAASSALNAYTRAEGDILDMFEANAAMEVAMSELMLETDDGMLSAKDESYRQKLYTEFNSRNDTISHDPYYNYAAAYNEILGRFPASLIEALTPVKEAPVRY